MADWTAVKARINYKLVADQDSTIDLSLFASYDSEFCKEARELLYDFTDQCHILYARRILLTTASLTAGIYEIDTLNDGVMPSTFQAVSQIDQLWINGMEVEQLGKSDERNELSYSVTNGQPNWVRLQDPYTLCFDRPLSDTELDSVKNYVNGWFVHKAIAANADPVKLTFRQINLFAEFAAAEMMRGAVNDDVALARMRMYDKRAKDGIAAINARQTAAYFGM